MSKYILKLWNKKYGTSAQFIVQNTVNKQYALFQPARAKDVAWVKADLTQDSEYKDWDNFQDEPVDNLNDIVM